MRKQKVYKLMNIIYIFDQIAVKFANLIVTLETILEALLI
jgi:hypothetical protein